MTSRAISLCLLNSSRRLGWLKEMKELNKSSLLPLFFSRSGVRGIFCLSAVPSVPPPPSPARVNLHHFTALFAFDVTAPVELTAAPVHHLHLLCLEATAAAHQLTAVDGLGCSVTLATHRAQHPWRAWIVIAEIWTWFQVDQVFIRVRFELGIARNKDFGCAHLPLLYLGSAVKLLLDDVAHLAKWWHGFPAGLHLTGAWDAVAFALHTHMRQDGLQGFQRTFGLLKQL